MDYLVFFLTPILIYFFNSYIVKKKLLTNFSGENHQKFLGTKNSPLSGGIFFDIIFVNYFYSNRFINICFFDFYFYVRIIL